MQKSLLFIFILAAAFAGNVFAQDTLPRITVKNISNQIIISWKNNYGAKISNINIQRSHDSLKNFITIGTVLNPLNKENGYVDSRATNPNLFYRVFAAFEGGTYFFSPSHKPVIDGAEKTATDNTLKQEAVPAGKQKIESVIAQDIDTSGKKATDNFTKLPGETPTAEHEKVVISAKEQELIPARKFPKPVKSVGFVPGKFIYTNRENNLIISLPDYDKVKFSLRFFDDKDRPVFEIKKINELYLIVEKVNFLHTGWFYYQLYDDSVLLEKYKFYIGKDGWVGPPPPETKKAPAPNEQ